MPVTGAGAAPAQGGGPAHSPSVFALGSGRPVGFVAADTGWVPASCTWTTERALSGSQACPGSFRSVLSGENACQ